MATKKQITANCQNSQNSRGPTTQEGKLAASNNALKHGLLSMKATAMPWENPEEKERFREKMYEELKPLDQLEAALVDHVVSALWKLRRVEEVENGVFAFHHFSILEQREKEIAEHLVREGSQSDPLPPPTQTALIANQPRYDQQQERIRQIRVQRDSALAAAGAAFIRDLNGPDVLARLRRYQTAHENTFYRALHELQRLQAARQGVPVPAPAALDVGVNMSTPEDGDDPDK